MANGPKAAPTRRREERREEILAVASELFAAKGIRATTMEQVAARLGVTKQALYYYVGSKEQVLIDLHERGFERLRDAMRASTQYAENPLRRIEFLIEQQVAVSTSPTFAFLIVAAPSDYPDNPVFQELVSENTREEHARWTEVIADAIDRGVFSASLDPAVTALGIIGMCSWTSRWYRDTGRLTHDEIAAQFTTLVIDSLRGASELRG